MIDENELKQKLSEQEYRILREKGTEAPFSGKAIVAGSDGNFHCRVCAAALFAQDSKFDSGTGWPSFDQAIPGAVKEKEDHAYGMRRMEILCSACESHLGHVFNDGPSSTGRRYCTNSVCFE